MSKRVQAPGCRQCPRECLALRPNEKGLCSSGGLRIASHNLHYGEEPPISGRAGSGTIFFSGCSLKCIFCQNYPISHMGNGRDITPAELILIMLELQERGAHNINLVSPSHFASDIREALLGAKKKGLKIPVVYNTSGYDSVKTLKTFEGLVDIYLPDMKFANAEISRKYCEVSNYDKISKAALLEMKRQAGDVVLEEGIALRGLIVRHLVLPGEILNSKLILKWILENLGNVYISIMSQYHPCYKAVGHPIIGRRLLKKEYDEVLDYAVKLGFTKGFLQEFDEN
ncbi:MAG: radical SAM protein [Elusimicrobia bacterium CG08_land_8_20_14_0_20_44_26]|nr:MAG: radical SAM protein [Elusimicrobia bacterium CG08_land_8_20_14_0_20_44_26]